MVEIPETNSDPTLEFVRRDFTTLPQYTGVKPLDVLAAELGYQIEELVKLDANENPYGPIQEIQDALANTEFLHIYPDPSQTHLREALASFLNKITNNRCSLTAENVVGGTGSDELLEVIIKLAWPETESTDRPGVITCGPTFGMYEFLGEIARIKTKNIPRLNAPFFNVDIDAVCEELKQPEPATKVLFLASPNNPTGGVLSVSEIRRICEVRKGLVVIDQAYAEFDMQLNSEEEDSNSVLDLLKEFPNLILLRTFSKWAGLAGSRIGYAIGHAKLIEKICALKQPYNVTVPTAVTVFSALDNYEKILKQQVYRIIEERSRMVLLLQEFSWLHACPSRSNFVLFKVTGVNAKEIYLGLRKKGVLVRYYSTGILASYIRISAGKPSDTDKVVVALRELETDESTFKSQKKKLDALIFDMDGVLAEVSKSYRSAIEATCTHFDAPVTQKDISNAKLAGNSNNDWVLTHKLVHSFSSATPTLDEVTKKFQEIYLGHGETAGLRNLETLIPSRSLLIELRKRCSAGFAIVTGRPRDECIHFLEEHNLTSLFTTVKGEIAAVCMNETKPKPSPDPVIKALAFLGTCDKSKIAMLGDTPDDVIAAKQAGIIPIGVILPGCKKDDDLPRKLIEVGADVVLEPGFAELLEMLCSDHTLYKTPEAKISKESVNRSKFTVQGTRSANVKRATKETRIECTVNLDGTGQNDISTGIGFLDHMLSAFSKHSRIDVFLRCEGDLWIDDHHTSEDVGIALGETIDKALGKRENIRRWGSAHCPLDESVTRAVVDVSSRPFCEANLHLKREKIGDLSTEMVTHALISICTSARLTVHVDCLKGDNDHHKAESAFKALGVALREAISFDGSAGVPSTKGVLA